MKITHKITTLFILTFYLMLNVACTPTIKAPEKAQARSTAQSSLTKDTHHHSNPYLSTNKTEKFNDYPPNTLSTVKESPFSKNLDRILSAKPEKVVNISGNIYLIDDDEEKELEASPLLKRVDGGAIDVEVKFK